MPSHDIRHRGIRPHYRCLSPHSLSCGGEGQALSKECEKGDESADMFYCGGSGNVYLFKAAHKSSFESEDMRFTAEKGYIGEAESPIYFEDFNYDGLPDVVVRNGNYGASSLSSN